MTMPLPGQAPAAPAARPEPFRVTPATGSPLEQLRDQYLAAKAAKEDAESRMKALGDRIKNETAAACGGYPVIDIAGNASAPTLRLAYRIRGHFEREALARDYPQIHAAYWVPGDPAHGTWELREVGS